MTKREMLNKDPQAFWTIFGEYLGAMFDCEVADLLSISVEAVANARNAMGIPPKGFNNAMMRHMALAKFREAASNGEVCRFSIEANSRWSGSSEATYRITLAEGSQRLCKIERQLGDKWKDLTGAEITRAITFGTPLGEWLDSGAPVDTSRFLSLPSDEPALLPLQ